MFAPSPPSGRPPSLAAQPKPQRSHSAEEWEAQRRKITDLYRIQDLTLPQVMSAMEREHGFYAT
jgi:hypothetical protein